MQLGLRVVESQQEIKKRILENIADELNRPFKIASSTIKQRLKEIITISIHSSEEFQSLIGGRLQGELGVPDVYKRLSDMLDIWTNTIEVSYNAPTVVGNTIRGGITIGAVDASFADVLALESAKYTTEKGQVIPWLSWLIEAGHQFIIRDYKVLFETQGLSRSRTGLAIMAVTPGTAWRVPEEYAGTTSNNFITRALNNIEEKVLSMIEKEIESKI